MMFHETKLPGVFEIHLESKPVERAFFARIWFQSGPQSVVPDVTGVGSPGGKLCTKTAYNVHDRPFFVAIVGSDLFRRGVARE